jgi:large subunit ribosomal protein L6
MSRIGRKPIPIPDRVKVELAGGYVSVEGPKGKLSLRLHHSMVVKAEDKVLHCVRPSDNKLHRSLHGLTRTLVSNMLEGVTKGFEKKLEMIGVGYRASVQGGHLTLMLGYSHPIVFPIPEGIKIGVENQNLLTVSGLNLTKLRIPFCLSTGVRLREISSVYLLLWVEPGPRGPCF